LKTILLVFAFVLCRAAPGLAWGQEGHSIVAEIAQQRVGPDTIRKLRALLGREVSLASVASWADDYRAQHRETSNWHFADIPYDQAAYDPARDCAKGCVVSALARFTAVLGDCGKPGAERTDALKFIVHFVGDIHQPLHAATRVKPDGSEDHGGNDVPVIFFGQSTNLHALWDTGLIMHTVYAWGTYVTRLQTGWLDGRDLSALQGGTPIDWAQEAHRLAHDVAYDVPDGGTLGESYYAKALPVLDRQLALGGVRLARLLDDTLGGAACP
jgi:hypothetical protein